jgi:hypothetical protein
LLILGASAALEASLANADKFSVMAKTRMQRGVYIRPSFEIAAPV